MPAENLNLVWAGAIWDELVRGGVTHAVVSPGARSAPLAIAAHRRADLRLCMVADERVAGFVALGLGRATGRPAVTVCTSGSAGAHHLPAVLEAAAAGVPLVVLTADRPWELHGFGAPQCCEQQGLYGGHVRRADALSTPEPSTAAVAHLRAVVARAVEVACGSDPGPVHLNVPFREPLAPTTDGLSVAALEELEVVPAAARALRLSGGQAASERLKCLAAARRPLLVCGPRAGPDGLAKAVQTLSARTGVPVLAEAASGARYGAAHESARLVTTYDLLLRDERVSAALRPDLLVRFGAAPTSRVLQQWLDGCGANTVDVVEGGRPVDPAHRSSAYVEGDGEALCDLLASHWSSTVEAGWGAELWALEQAARESLTEEAALLGLCEPTAARAVAKALRPEALWVVSNSLPIRDVDAFVPRAPFRLDLLANRGLNGIDGQVSTAVGAALSAQRPVVLSTGDVALTHDLGGWAAAAALRVNLTVVVLNNGGGAIFHQLPIGGYPELVESLFATPPRVQWEQAAAMVGARFSRPASVAELEAAVRMGQEGGLSLVEVVAERDQSQKARQRLQHAASRAARRVLR